MKAVLKGIIVVSVLASIGWWARAASDEHEAGGRFQVNVDMVQLRATVTNSTGDYICNLTKDDFRVFENGVEQKIRVVTGPPQPETRTNVVILVDTSNQMYETFAYLEDSVADFIRELAPPDAITIFGFSRNTVRLAPLTTDRMIALNGIWNAVLGDQTSLYDSMLLGLRAAERIDGSKVLVVFSNGPDSGSMLTADDIRTVAEDGGIPVYVVSGNVHDKTANAVLASLAVNTGGRTYSAPDWRKQKAAFASINRDLDNSYRISYYPSPTAAPGYRKIDVQIVSDRAHALRIRTRGGYRVSVSNPDGR